MRFVVVTREDENLEDVGDDVIQSDRAVTLKPHPDEDRVGEGSQVSLVLPPGDERLETLAPGVEVILSVRVVM